MSQTARGTRPGLDLLFAQLAKKKRGSASPGTQGNQLTRSPLLGLKHYSCPCTCTVVCEKLGSHNVASQRRTAEIRRDKHWASTEPEVNSGAAHVLPSLLIPEPRPRPRIRHLAAMKVSDLRTPAFLVDLNQVRTNCESMIEICRQAGITLRPDMKTHRTL